MKSFFKSKIFKRLLLVLLIIFIGMGTAEIGKSKSNVFSKAFSYVFSPMEKGAAWLSAKIESAGSVFVSSKTYKKRITELEEQVADYRDKLVDYENLKNRVKTYSDFLGVKEKNPDYTFVSGAVISSDAADSTGGFVLGCGEKDGVKVGDPVIYGRYLIGKIISTTQNTAAVLPVSSPKFSASIYDIRTGETGYINTFQSDNGKIRMSGLSDGTNITEGGIICTVGAGGVFPEDLILGTVKEIRSSGTGSGKSALIEPGVKTNDVKNAFVITGFEGKNNVAVH